MKVIAFLGKMSCSLVDRYNYQTKLNHIALNAVRTSSIKHFISFQDFAFMFFVGGLLGCEGCGGRCMRFWGICCYHLRCRSEWDEDTVILTGCKGRGQEREDQENENGEQEMWEKLPFLYNGTSEQMVLTYFNAVTQTQLINLMQILPKTLGLQDCRIQTPLTNRWR
jgi:hypothetical protein